VNVTANPESHGGAKKDGSGMYLYPKVKSYGVGIAPEAKAVLTLNFTGYVNINRGGSNRTKLTSTDGNVNVNTTNKDMHVYVDPGADGKACAGSSDALAEVIANLENLIWIDAADISAKNKVSITASNGDSPKGHIVVDTLAELYSAGGKVRAENWMKGKWSSQIRSNSTKNVTFKAASVAHTATTNVYAIVDYHRNRAFVTTVKKGGTNWQHGSYWRCDFCGKSGGNDRKNTDDINTRDANEALLGGALEKALSPLSDIQRQVETITAVTRARYGEEDIAAADELYVLEKPVMLEENARIEYGQIAGYLRWNNTETGLDVYLLPNATRLYGRDAGYGTVLDYVAEVLRGDIFGDGGIYEIDIITALNERAFAQPEMPVGSSGALDFRTGTLTLPTLADFELYLDEVSGAWLIDGWKNGFFQMLSGAQDEINECALNGGNLPQGTVREELTDGGETDGLHCWWVGDTPETAADPDQTLVYFVTNAETDEVDAFRTSVNMIRNGEEPVDVSLYLYRDSNADRMEEEKYNVMFFDTPNGEKSLVKVITNSLMGRSLETPLAMRIVLRGRYLAGADLPVYAISGHLFAMCDGTDGGVSMFEGIYSNTFLNGVFESAFIRIEDILSGRPTVIVKRGQFIWAVETETNLAVDLQGRRYVFTDGEWYPEDEMPVRSAQGEDAA
jgi:hypothetical protein